MTSRGTETLRHTRLAKPPRWIPTKSLEGGLISYCCVTTPPPPPPRNVTTSFSTMTPEPVGTPSSSAVSRWAGCSFSEPVRPDVWPLVLAACGASRDHGVTRLHICYDAAGPWPSFQAGRGFPAGREGEPSTQAFPSVCLRPIPFAPRPEQAPWTSLDLRVQKRPSCPDGGKSNKDTLQRGV